MIAFVHAAVLPMDVERVLRDQAVVVREGKVVELDPTAEVKVPKDAQRVEAKGRYLLPALCDMHVHVVGESWNADRGEVLGSRMILGRMIDGPGKAWPPPLSVWAASAAEARDAVRRGRAEGYDRIKAYSFLSRESYDAIVAAAREVGMDAIGHVLNAHSVEYVLNAGQKVIVHSEEVRKHAGDDEYDPSRAADFADLMAKRGCG